MANTALPSNPVGWFEIYVDDLARAKTFYQDVLKRPLEDMPMSPDSDMQMCMFTMNPTGPGAAGALVKSSDMKPGSAGTLVYFSCADCAVEAALAAAHGGTVLQPKTSIGEYGYIAMVRDTEGNTIGLHSQA